MSWGLSGLANYAAECVMKKWNYVVILHSFYP
jgi:hypothetical protein